MIKTFPCPKRAAALGLAVLTGLAALTVPPAAQADGVSFSLAAPAAGPRTAAFSLAAPEIGRAHV